MAIFAARTYGWHYDQERWRWRRRFRKACCSRPTGSCRRSIAEDPGGGDAKPILYRTSLKLGLPPSTETLVILIRGMVGHFLDIPRDPDPDHEEAQRLRLMVISQLQDGEFARLLFDKIGDTDRPDLYPSAGARCRDRRCGADRKRADGSFLFAHHTAMMAALSRLPSVP